MFFITIIKKTLNFNRYMINFHLKTIIQFTIVIITKKQKYNTKMRKVIIIGTIPNKTTGLDILARLIASSIQSVKVITKEDLGSLDDINETSKSIIEALGYDELPLEELRKEIEVVERNFELKKEISDIQLQSIRVSQEEYSRPWYERFEKKSKKDRFNYNSKAFNTKKKWTRKKWIPSLF